ncbi:MAG: putative Ig domain-containing protein, partial [Chloroflexi bacterium]|nr:putative Ig domain-containing protein [Chloroflexota bacterium]
MKFSLGPGAPGGAGIDPASGAFSWTPNEAQGPGVHTLTVTVSDNGSPPLSDSETITVTVNEVNTAPVLSIEQNNNQVTLTWVGQGQLQTAAELTGPWNNIPGASNPYPLEASGAKKFYRLKAVSDENVVTNLTYHGGMIQYDRWQSTTDAGTPPLAETCAWTPVGVFASPAMPTGPADPVYTTEILDPNGNPISGAHGVIAWPASINGVRASHMVIWTANRVLLHERLANNTIEVLSNDSPITNARGALHYRTAPVSEFENEEFVVWTKSQVFKVRPGAGATVLSIAELGLPSGIIGAAAYEEETGPWTGPTLAFWGEAAGVFLHALQTSTSFEVVAPGGSPIAQPQAVVPYRRTFPNGGTATELYIRTPAAVLRRPALAGGAAGPFGTVAFLLPGGVDPIAGARGVMPFERVLNNSPSAYTEVLIWTGTQMLLWSEALLPGNMATLPLLAPSGANLSNPQGAVVYLNYGPFGIGGTWSQWTEIALWTPTGVFLHVTPIHYPGPPLATLEVLGPTGLPLAGIRGGQAYPRIESGLYFGMELCLWGADNVYLHERFNNPLAGLTQEVLTPGGTAIIGARGAAAATRVGSLITGPRTQVAIWRQGNVYLLDAPKPPAPANAITGELLTPSTDAGGSVPIPNVWASLFETTPYHQEFNELWLWSPERVLLQRDGSLVTVNVLAPNGDRIGVADPVPLLASLAVDYGCVPWVPFPHSPTNGMVLLPPRTSSLPPPPPPLRDPGAGFQGVPSFAPVVRTTANGVVSGGQPADANVHVPVGSPSARSSALYVTQPQRSQGERAAIIGPNLVASLVPQCGCIYFTAQTNQPPQVTHIEPRLILPPPHSPTSTPSAIFVFGVGFSPTAVVDVDGMPLQNQRYVGPNLITGNLPELTPGFHQVGVTSVGGTQPPPPPGGGTGGTGIVTLSVPNVIEVTTPVAMLMEVPRYPFGPMSVRDPCADPESKGTGIIDPVHFFSGELYLRETDLRIPGRGMDFIWERTYCSRRGFNSAQGNGWVHSYNVFLQQSGQNIDLNDGRGRIDTYYLQPDGSFMARQFFHEGRFIDGKFVVKFADTATWEFLPLDGTAAQGKIARLADRNGNALTFAYDPLGRLDKVTDTLNRDILIAYDDNGFIASVTDFAGRSAKYGYYQSGEAGGGSGDLKSVTSPSVNDTPNGNDFPDGKTRVYTYTLGFGDDRLNHNLRSITDAKGQTYVENVYSPAQDPDDLTFDRVTRQVWGGGVIDLTYV